jgi:hypothetical protein
MPLSTIFQLYRGRLCFIGGKTGVPGKKTTDLQQDTDKLYHTMLYRVHLVRSSGQKPSKMSSNILKNVILVQLL